MTDDLIAQLQQEHIINDERIAFAFRSVDRRDFTRAPYKNDSIQDIPLPIGQGQTISQPRTVAFMLSLLHAEEGNHVLDVGAGSGWTCALLGTLVGPRGSVLGIERITELTAFARSNIASYSFTTVSIREATDAIGAPDEAPFDRILVSASATDLPDALVTQLAIGGILVIPVQNALWQVQKNTDQDVSVMKYPGFSFVPLITP